MDKLLRHEDLTSDEAAAAMGEIMEGRAAAAHVAGLLIGLAMKGERPTEIVGLAKTMRAHAVQVSKRHERVFDTCGTGGDRSGTFNISSCAAVVMSVKLAWLSFCHSKSPPKPAPTTRISHSSCSASRWMGGSE